MLETLEKLDVSPSSTKVLINAVVQKERLKEISLAAYEVTENRKTAEEFNSLLEKYKQVPEEEQDEDEFVTSDLEALVNSTIKTPGLRWRLGTLNKMLGSLRKGNFGFIFARPETGKTTFLASEVTFMAENLPDDAGPILWINNEQPGDEVMLRLYQSCLGVDLARVLSDVPRAQTAFIKRTKDKIKINKDKGKIHKNDVEKWCRNLKPSLVVVDQLDAIEGFNNDREDLKLGAIYQWARELAKEFCPFIAVSQADGTGEGIQWLNMGHVANAKTAKQAMADWILGIGKKNDAGFESLRYLHASKNKLLGDEDTDPNLRHGKCEVLIEPHLGRYKDLR